MPDGGVVIFVFVVGVFLSVSGFLSSSGVATIGVSSGVAMIAGGFSIGSVTSESTDRMRLQLVSVREMRARGKRLFIVKKDRDRAEAEDRERNLLV